MAGREYQNCWIRGKMKESDNQDDPVRMATIQCPYRKGINTAPNIFGETVDYVCTHPFIKKRGDNVQLLSNGGIMIGGVDGFANFCIPVDMHLRSLGRKSKLILIHENSKASAPVLSDVSKERVWARLKRLFGC